MATTISLPICATPAADRRPGTRYTKLTPPGGSSAARSPPRPPRRLELGPHESPSFKLGPSVRRSGPFSACSGQFNLSGGGQKVISDHVDADRRDHHGDRFLGLAPCNHRISRLPTSPATHEARRNAVIGSMWKVTSDHVASRVSANMAQRLRWQHSGRRNQSLRPAGCLRRLISE